jgi:hypothetical protein
MFGDESAVDELDDGVLVLELDDVDERDELLVELVLLDDPGEFEDELERLSPRPSPSRDR